MKLLITGSGGFVAGHFLTLLNEVAPGSAVLGIDRNEPVINPNPYNNLSVKFERTDLADPPALAAVIRTFQPTHILHLASVSSVAESWKAPGASFLNNTGIFIHIAEQVRVNKLNCRILSVGSSEEYGPVRETGLPVTEDHPLQPNNPYAVARVSQEMLSELYVEGFGMDIVMTRSFHHIGAGQKPHFVIPSFAKQLVEMAARSQKENVLVTGDISVVRDFLDVRDMVKAYYLLLEKGKPGEVYNICSGKGTSLREIIQQMAALLGMEVTTVTDEKLLRPNESKKIIGSYEKIRKELDWQPAIPLEKTLADILAYWQSRS